jgi:hypothetical protein
MILKENCRARSCNRTFVAMQDATPPSVRPLNAGLRIFDISDPRLPKEVGYFMPPERPGLPEHAGAHASPINWSEEVAVDARGNIYLNDDKWGTFVLRYTGKVPDPSKSAAK